MQFDLATLAKRRTNRRRKLIELRALTPPATFATDLYRAVYLPTVAAWERAAPRILAAYERSLSELVQDSAADIRAELDAAEPSGLAITVRAALGRWAAMVAGWHTRRWSGAVLSATNVDLSTMIGVGDTRETLEALIERNVALVSSVSDEARRRIADATFRGLTNRTPAEQVGRQIREAVAMSRRRAKNIAADQLVKASSALNEERRRQAGISAWTWVHSDKRNPRPEHEERDGRLYSDDPNDAGFQYEGRTVRRVPEDKPGELPYCGCTTRAVLILGNDPNKLSQGSFGDEVVSKGKASSNEHVVAVDEAGEIIGRAEGAPDTVSYTIRMIAAVSDPQRSITIHHNHPSSVSLSQLDVNSLARNPGLREMRAYGHNGSRFTATDAANGEIERDYARIRSQVEARFTSDFSRKAARLLEAHVVMLAMDRKGLLRYTHRLRGPTKSAANRHSRWIEETVNAIARTD